MPSILVPSFVAVAFNCSAPNFVPYTILAGFPHVIVGEIVFTVSFNATAELLPAYSPSALVYCAVMLCVPAGSDEIVSVAVYGETVVSNFAPPIGCSPSKNCTVPLGACAFPSCAVGVIGVCAFPSCAAGVTVAVNVTV